MNTHDTTHPSRRSKRLDRRVGKVSTSADATARSDLALAATHDARTPDTPRHSEPNQPADQDQSRPPRRRLVNVVGGVGFVVVWLLLGSALALGFVDHLLLGAPLLVAFQTLVRRRPLRTLVARDSATFAHRWPGRLLVATVLVLIPATILLLSRVCCTIWGLISMLPDRRLCS